MPSIGGSHIIPSGHFGTFISQTERLKRSATKLAARMTAQLASLRETARSYFDEEASPAHDWQHVRRVETLAERLLTDYPDADERVVRAAVLLHDIGRPREDRGEISDHAEWGAQQAREILPEHGFDSTDGICHAVRAHRYSTAPEPDTLEAKLLSDADNLDALGAVGIARCFTYGGELGEVLHDPDCPPSADETTDGATQFNHFYKKILSLPDRMYTDAGREIATDRRHYVEAFLDRFEQEVAGER